MDVADQQAISPADLAFIQGHTRGVIKSMKPRLLAVKSAYLNAAPVCTAAPTISGTGTVGQTLITTNGSWLFSPSLAYKWQHDGIDIPGATTVNYVLAAGDSGKSIRSVVVATNAKGTTNQPSSNSIVCA